MKINPISLTLQILFYLMASSRCYLFDEPKLISHMIHYMLKDTEKTKVSLLTAYSDKMSYHSTIIVQDIVSRFPTTVVNLNELGPSNETLITRIAQSEDVLRVIYIDGYEDEELVEKQLNRLVELLQQLTAGEPYPCCLFFLLSDGHDRNSRMILEHVHAAKFLHENTIEIIHLKLEPRRAEMYIKNSPDSIFRSHYEFYNDTFDGYMDGMFNDGDLNDEEYYDVE